MTNATATLPLAALLLAALLVLGLRPGSSLDAAGLHPADMDCRDCHLAQGAIDAANARILVSTQEALCGSCHQAALTASHPTGIKPTSSIPARFPLDWKGDMTCSTCHRVHDRNPLKLRAKRAGRELCQSCHAPEFFARMKDGGASVMNFGHLDAGTQLAGGIDNFSIQCMACHEELGGELQVRVSGRLIRHGGNRVSHPVGVRYADSIAFGGYRPVAGIERAIQLPDGKVSCISCHRGYSEKHGGLVIDNQRDKLCYSCHDL